MTGSVTPISVQELAEWQQQGRDFFLLDVREPHEAAKCRIADSTLIPMGQVPGKLEELPRDVPVIAYCHHGGRSMQVSKYLQHQGFTDIFNLTGGIDQWAVHIEPEMERY